MSNYPYIYTLIWRFIRIFCSSFLSAITAPYVIEVINQLIKTQMTGEVQMIIYIGLAAAISTTAKAIRDSLSDNPASLVQKMPL